MNAVIYVKNNCPKCKLTEKRLKVPISKIKHLEDLSENELAKFRASGILSTPIVYIYDSNNNLQDSWNDFQINKINEWNEKID